MMNEWPTESDATPHLASAAEVPPIETGCGCGGDGMVLKRTIKIVNSRGLHARAAAKLVALAERYSACLNLSHGGQSVPACSIMGLMMLGAGQGSDVLLEAEGWDAREALDAVAGLIEAGFHED
ncbi:HPr family phosphocarrier protein [Roseococcus sp.]|uniref:HPr family phosphocarrier protein n=1 Tax=Roseococcus sp. TaxID=2109646 RepID=UPI003BAD405C